jgi:hypothetical protein
MVKQVRDLNQPDLLRFIWGEYKVIIIWFLVKIYPQFFELFLIPDNCSANLLSYLGWLGYLGAIKYTTGIDLNSSAMHRSHSHPIVLAIEECWGKTTRKPMLLFRLSADLLLR